MKLSTLYTYYDTHLWTRILYIIILSFFPVFVALLVQDIDVYNYISENIKVLLFFYPDTILKKFITAFWVPVLTVITHVLGYLSKKDYYYLTKEKFSILADSLDEIVAKKSERVGKAIKASNCDIEKILAPEQQIKIIIDEMYHTIKSMFSIKDEVAIRLWSIKNNDIVGLLYSIPSKAELTTDYNLLRSNNSELKKVIRTKRPTIINDSKNSKDFVMGNNCNDCMGCNLFTIPIIDNVLDNSYAVLQIRIKFNENKKIIFQSKNKRIYISILDRYIKRINYEHRVYCLLKTRTRSSQ